MGKVKYAYVNAGGTSVTGAVLCPENETRTIVSLDTSKVFASKMMQPSSHSGTDEQDPVD